jgi:hypothetical protein
VPYQHVAHLRQRTATLLRGVEARFGEAAAADFPGDGPGKVIKIVLLILEELTITIQASASDKQLASIRWLLDLLASLTKYLDHSHSEHTPQGLVDLLGDFLKKMDPGAELVVWPDSVRNYSIADLRQPLQHIVANFVPVPRQAPILALLNHSIKLISFPKACRDDILAHAIFGHELGHPYASEYLGQENGTAAYTTELATVTNRIKSKIASSHPKPLSPAELLKRAGPEVSLVLEIRKRALEELVSDAVGILTFGPAALFAFYDLLNDGDWDALPSGPDLYPPSRMRIRLMRELAKKEGLDTQLATLKSDAATAPYAAAVEAWLAEIDALTSVKTDLTAIASDDLIKEAYDWVTHSLSGAISFAQSRIGGSIYPCTTISAEIPALLRRIELAIPPNEFGPPDKLQSAHPISALLASWIYSICGQCGTPPATMAQADHARVEKITMRAIEFIMLRARYNAKVVPGP